MAIAPNQLPTCAHMGHANKPTLNNVGVECRRVSIVRAAHLPTPLGSLTLTAWLLAVATLGPAAAPVLLTLVLPLPARVTVLERIPPSARASDAAIWKL